jgi:hypothetical protein
MKYFTIFCFLLVVTVQAQDRLYYTTKGSTYTVSRANSDGSDIEVLVPDDSTQAPSGITLNLTINCLCSFHPENSLFSDSPVNFY